VKFVGLQLMIRDAVIKENPVLSGILQKGGGGGGSQGPPVPDSFHLGKSGNPDREGGGGIRIWNKRINGF
jgi:hypothetical protein